MGGLNSAPNNHLEKELGIDFPEGEHFIGFENKNNICYANSILQALYYCEDFRKNVLAYKGNESSDNPLCLLQNVFLEISNHKKKVGVINTRKFMSFVRKKNELFQGDNHQDTQEFLIWLLNMIDETLQKGNKKKKDQNSSKNWLQHIFEGVTTTETVCLSCNNKSTRDEPFLDISLDLDQNISLNYCLKKYSNAEMLKGSDKFDCETCKCKREAEKRELIKKLPKTLIFHLKRFKYDENLKRMIKLYWRIPFPLELRWKTSECTENESYLYNLYAIIVHLGTGFQYGHYISIIKNNGKWFSFDDETINIVDERAFMNIFGSNSGSTTCAYMLFYQMASSDPNLGMSSPMKNHK